jgi:hypothetical protein
MNWVSVLMEKPAVGSNVAILYSSGSTTTAKYDGTYFSDDGLLVEGISHWIELPQIPKERVRYDYEDVSS